MEQFFASIDWNAMVTAIKDTLYMSFVSLAFAVVLGLIIGIVVYITKKDGLLPNPIIHTILDGLVNIFRAVPFIILMFILIPLTTLLVGTMLGAKAALPTLIISAIPFYARICLIAFNEVDMGTIEASKAMGASRLQIIFKVLIPESAPALVSGIALMGISLVSYTAMAGAIGSGGLGNLAYLYGFARRNNAILYTSTFFIVVIVFVIQFIGDYVSKKIDKR